MLMDIIKARHSIRKYTDKQISRADMELILEAANYAPNADAFCCAENMVLQAAEFGISSCIISRGAETFAGDGGRALMKEWGVPENYSAVCFVILGYIDGEPPHRKPRRENRIKIIE